MSDDPLLNGTPEQQSAYIAETMAKVQAEIEADRQARREQASPRESASPAVLIGVAGTSDSVAQAVNR